MRVVTDASVLVSVFHPADQFHQQSRAWFQQHLRDGGRIVAPNFMLSEVAGALARRTDSTAVAELAVTQLRTMPELELVVIEDVYEQEATALAMELRLRGADAIYVAVAHMLDLPLTTWDREQVERGGQRIDARRPDNS
jgi:predicted nucleic acid-binding protein